MSTFNLIFNFYFSKKKWMIEWKNVILHFQFIFSVQ